MADQTGTSYLAQVVDVLSSTEVTGQDGEKLGIDDGTSAAVQLLSSVAQSDGQVLLIGNGGSAAIASHMQNDLSKALGLRAMTFTEPPLLSALANDEGYGSVFERPIRLWLRKGDLLIAISSSGRSENILRGVRACLVGGGHAITFTGFAPDNPLRRLGRVNYYVPSQVYGYVESIHGVLTHLVSDCASRSCSQKPPSSATT